MTRKIGDRFEKYNGKKIITAIALMAMISLVDGRGAAKIITALIKDACKKSDQKKYQDEYYRTVLYRLKRDGLVAIPERGIWMITLKGRRAAQVIQAPRTPKPVVSREEADIAVIFDIPETDRKKRSALRYELFMRGFFAFQKSVWLGKGPLDVDFIEFLKTTHLLKYVHIFNIGKRGTL